jgi:hypothetical protein
VVFCVNGRIMFYYFQMDLAMLHAVVSASNRPCYLSSRISKRESLD